MTKISRNDDVDVNSLVAQADSNFSAKRMLEAMNGYRQVLALCPRDAHALHRIGLSYAYTDNLDEAYTYRNLALDIAPERAELREHAGIREAMKGNHPSARTSYQRAMNLAGDTASLHRNLADSLRLSGHFVEAIAHYEQSLEIEPGLHHAVRALAVLSSQLGRNDDAARYWRQAWKLDSTILSVGLDLIRALAKLERRDEIGGVVETIRSSFSFDAEALQELAHTLNCMHYFKEAIGVAREGLDIDPRNALLHHNATYACGMLGEL
jgi:tetratricopeptide (TPR) repeat protein